MKNLPLLMCTAFCGLNAVQADAADNKKNERPNILWLTFEDTSAYEFGCYGNKGVHTPNADSLAVHGIQFMNAWSVSAKFCCTLVTYHRLLLLKLRNGCPSGSIRHSGKHILPSMATGSRILLH